MKADDHAPSAGVEKVGEVVEELRELVELAVDRDAQGLERARRGVDLHAPPGRCGNGGFDDRGQIEGGGEATGAQGLLDRARDAAAVLLLAVVADHLGQLGGRQPLEQGEGGLPRARVHAHVDRSGLLKREPALRPVELR